MGNGEEGHIDQEVVARNQLGIDLADNRHAREFVGERQRDVAEAAVGGELRRAPALPEPLDAEKGGEARRQHVDGDARDQLVALQRDGCRALQRRGGHRHGDAGHEAKPDIVGDGSNGGGAKAAASILPSSPISKTPARSE